MESEYFMVVKSISEVIDAASRVADYINANDETPKTVKVGNSQVTRPTFNRMMAATVLEINNGSMQNILTNDVKDPTNPQGGLPDGKLMKVDYVKAALNVKDFIGDKWRMPNYIVTSLGNMSPFNFTDIFSRILNFYQDYKYLPNFAYTNGIGSTTTTPKITTYPAEIKPYLQPSVNCQSDNSAIKNLASQIVGNETSTYNKAYKIFEWGRKVKNYANYYNTRYGALAMINKLAGNCCDLSHLLVALFRAAGIPAGYLHVYAQFSTFKTGHVVSCCYVDGKWLEADASNNKNKLGNTLSWKTVKKYGFYKELPF